MAEGNGNQKDHSPNAAGKHSSTELRTGSQKEEYVPKHGTPGVHSPHSGKHRSGK